MSLEVLTPEGVEPDQKILVPKLVKGIPVPGEYVVAEGPSASDMKKSDDFDEDAPVIVSRWRRLANYASESKLGRTAVAAVLLISGGAISHLLDDIPSSEASDNLDFSQFTEVELEPESLATRYQSLLAQVEDSPAQIVPVEFERGAGRQSFVWLPALVEREGAESADLSVFYKVDNIDITLNGSYSKAAQVQKYTADIIAEANGIALSDPEGDDADGYCRDAAAASAYAPLIYGSTNVLGYEFSERERMKVAVMAHGGFALDPDYRFNITQEMMDDMYYRFIAGQAVIADHSDVAGQEWWGVVREIWEDGTIIITRHQRWYEEGQQTVSKHFSQLQGMAALNPDRAQPGFEGNFGLLDRRVAGLIIGTHRLE